MKTFKDSVKVGIDDMVAYIPGIYLPIEALAQARHIEYAKLNKGLGLTSMSYPDAHEDAATMAANAIRRLIEQNGISPQQIGRIYMGTESALDGSKPTASYVLGMLSQYFEEDFGNDCFRNCDVVDLTFACIGAVDAMQNTLDWVRGGEDRVGIVVGSDIAKYDLVSTGEYTQGAGAIAMLIKKAPRLIAFESDWGVSCKSVHDFFKPKRKYNKADIINEVLDMAGITSTTAEELLNRLNGHLEGKGIISMSDKAVYLHKDTPVFDGPYSNDCYQARIKEALQHFADQAQLETDEAITDNWRRLIFHLPYAFQARRMFSEIYLEESKKRGDFEELLKETGIGEPQEEQFETLKDFQKAKGQFLRAITKTARYRQFVQEKIEKGERASSQVGNLYTSSIFLSLMSTLEADLEANVALEGQLFGFFAYGSGAKSKVFEGEVQPGWKEVVSRFRLMNGLSDRKAIKYSTYEQLHRAEATESVQKPQNEFAVVGIHEERDDQEGARTYKWVAKVVEKRGAHV